MHMSPRWFTHFSADELLFSVKVNVNRVAVLLWRDTKSAFERDSSADGVQRLRVNAISQESDNLHHADRQSAPRFANL